MNGRRHCEAMENREIQPFTHVFDLALRKSWLGRQESMISGWQSGRRDALENILLSCSKNPVSPSHEVAKWLVSILLPSPELFLIQQEHDDHLAIGNIKALSGL